MGIAGQYMLHADDGGEGHGAWLEFVETAARPSKSRHGGGDDEKVARANWQGTAVTGFSQDPHGLLPSALVDGADYWVTVDGPLPCDIAAVTRGITSKTSRLSVSVAEAVACTPRIVRLACRGDQSPDDYVQRLQRLVEAALRSDQRPLFPPAPTLDRLHGMDELVAWGLGVQRDLDAFRAGDLPIADMDRACLVSGPPGVGKSQFARSLAVTLGVPLVSGSYGAWLGTGTGHQGDLLKAMGATFNEARNRAPCILLLDEVDSFPNRSTLRHAQADWGVWAVNQLLLEFDAAITGRYGVIVIACCNQPRLLYPALVRTGRLDRHIRVDLPDAAALEGILHEHLGGALQRVSLSRVATLLTGSSSADCERLVRSARRRARMMKREVELAELIAEAVGNVAVKPADLWTAAIHEAGHALAACVLKTGALRSVVLRVCDGAAGGTLIEKSAGFTTWKGLHDRLVFTLAGRAAEQVAFKRVTSAAGGGPQSDLAQATGLAAAAMSAHGFGPDPNPHRGLLWRGFPTSADLPKLLNQDRGFAASVEGRLECAYRDALSLMDRRRAALVRLAADLAVARALDHAELEAILARYPAPSNTRELRQ